MTRDEQFEEWWMRTEGDVEAFIPRTWMKATKVLARTTVAAAKAKAKEAWFTAWDLSMSSDTYPHLRSKSNNTKKWTAEYKAWKYLRRLSPASWPRFAQFIESMGPRPEGFIIGRRVYSKPHSVENTIWVIKSEGYSNNNCAHSRHPKTAVLATKKKCVTPVHIDRPVVLNAFQQRLMAQMN